MKKNRILNKQINAQLRIDASSRASTGTFEFAFRPEIQNGYFSGYQMLHGPHEFTISGTAEVIDNKIIYSYTATWIDVIDPEPSYSLDIFLSEVLNHDNTAKDYSVTISWDTSIKIKR